MTLPKEPYLLGEWAPAMVWLCMKTRVERAKFATKISDLREFRRPAKAANFATKFLQSNVRFNKQFIPVEMREPRNPVTGRCFHVY